ncbi:MAG TPA: GNAT family N-acetyltransferase [Gaiellales bacterium]|nr:GNAT family N-acetyltransferase [Gaiellales bacterium]
MSVDVVTAGPERVDEVEPLWTSLHRHHRSVSPLPLVADDGESWRRRRAWYLEMLAGGEDVLLLAERDGRAVGYAFLHFHAGPDDTWPVGTRWAELVSLAVLPEERGAGVGSALMDAVDERLAAAGVSDLEVAVMAGNAGAIRFYERRGLRPGELLLYRFGADADAAEA